MPAAWRATQPDKHCSRLNCQDVFDGAVDRSESRSQSNCTVVGIMYVYCPAVCPVRGSVIGPRTLCSRVFMLGARSQEPGETEEKSLDRFGLLALVHVYQVLQFLSRLQ
jgi:hypothetical protein